MIRELSYSFVCLVVFIFTTSCGVRLTATQPIFTQQDSLYRHHPGLSTVEIDSLRELYPNITFCEEFIEPTLIALSYFPELRDLPIEFKYSNGSTTMAARPKPISMFFKRRYVITINSKEEFDGILLKNVPFNAQIGIIAHELAHIADYNNRNFFGVSSILFRFADPRRKSLFEKEIDRATIERGVGWQLYDWATYAMETNPYATEEYKEFKRKNYMQPHEIQRLINFYSGYNSSK